MPPLEFELLSTTTATSTSNRLRFKPAPLQCQPFHLLHLSADEGGTRPASATGSTRLHEIIARVGEICLSPELSRIMMPAEPAEPAQPATTTSSSINMETTPASLRQSAGLLADLQARCMPKPTLVTLRQPLHLAAWRVETSPRVCLFTGTDQDISTSITDAPPHTLPKILLEDRSKRPAPSRIHLLVPDDDISPVAIRTSLLHHAQTALVPYTHQRLPLAQINQPVLDHTLEEAVACLIHAPPLHHTHIELNEQPAPWDKDHIDSR